MIKQVVGFLLSTILGLTFCLFLNGNINIQNLPLPPLGKFLNPSNGVWQNARHGYYDASISEKSLSGEVKVVYDERYIPHIFANNIEDALFVQGYVEASNRLFQMDFISRAAGGRVSEVLGGRTLEVDIMNLKKGMNFAADQAVTDWAKFPDAMKKVERYVAGVNHYIKNLSAQDYPIEYKLLNFKPEMWSVKKTALVYKYMADMLCGDSNDLEDNNTRALLGDDLFYQLYPSFDTKTNPIVPEGKQLVQKPDTNRVSRPNSVYNKALPRVNFENTIPGIGSNNWVISGAKSTTGFPILCSDPHLGLNLPSVWIEQQIVTPTINCYGVSIPGVPGILIGFNQHVAWAETNVGIDVKDQYVIQWKNNQRGGEYVFDNTYKKAILNVHEVKVRKSKSYFDTTYITDFGRVVHFSKDSKSDIAVNWVADESLNKDDIMTFINLMEAKDVKDFDLKLATFTTPAQNFISADNSGNIAIRVNGRLPARSNEDGRILEVGVGSANLWKDYIPFEDLPHALNPKQGFLTSSNQQSTGSSYPYFYYMSQDDHYRNHSIRELLLAREKFSVKEMRSMQGNTSSFKAKRILPMWRKIATKPALDYLSKMKDWDYNFDKDDVAPSYFIELFSQFEKLTFDEVYKFKDSFDINNPKSHIVIDILEKDPNHKIFDDLGTAELENAARILEKAVAYAEENLNSTKDKKVSDLRWGAKRKTNIEHLIKIPAFGALNLEVDGHPDCINAVSTAWGPSWRMVVHLKEDIEAWGVYPGGQSGDPASKFYKNFLDKWLRKEHYKLYCVKKADDLKEHEIQTINFTK